MRFRTLGAAAFAVAACTVAQPASATSCVQQPSVVRVCEPLSAEPLACAEAPYRELCIWINTDLCVWTSDGTQVTCLPMHWPPV